MSQGGLAHARTFTFTNLASELKGFADITLGFRDATRFGQNVGQIEIDRMAFLGTQIDGDGERRAGITFLGGQVALQPGDVREAAEDVELFKRIADLIGDLESRLV